MNPEASEPLHVLEAPNSPSERNTLPNRPTTPAPTAQISSAMTISYESATYVIPACVKRVLDPEMVLSRKSLGQSTESVKSDITFGTGRRYYHAPFSSRVPS